MGAERYLVRIMNTKMVIVNPVQMMMRDPEIVTAQYTDIIPNRGCTSEANRAYGRWASSWKWKAIVAKRNI